MGYPDARIYLLDGAGIREVAYTETEHYQVTSGFLANPKRSLDVLLADSSEQVG
jgi:predicted ATPase